MATNVEFRHAADSTILGRTRGVTTVPAPGEVVNVNGHPYIVADRSWAADTNGLHELWCFVKLAPMKPEPSR